ARKEQIFDDFNDTSTTSTRSISSISSTNIKWLSKSITMAIFYRF
ncbi:unnamed protein product, partial [Rotaria magnacalcarata]